MANHMYVRGKAWDAKQASDEIAAISAASAPGGPGGDAVCRPDGALVRSFRALGPYRGRAEQAALEQ
eukprot:1903894-Pyramimonas_sp.AAC.1